MARITSEESRIVEISPRPSKAKVVRSGFSVPPVKIDAQKAEFEIDRLETVPPRSLPRVISQSIAAGTKVMQNTVVDLVVAPKAVIPFKIVANVHPDLKDQTLDFVDDIIEDSRSRELLLRYETGEDVPAAEKAFLISQFRTKGIVVDESSAERNFSNAFKSVQAGATFF